MRNYELMSLLRRKDFYLLYDNSNVLKGCIIILC